MILAFIFRPAYKWLSKKTKKERLSAVLITILVLLIILVPFGFVINEVIKESTVTFVSLKQKLAAPQTCSEQDSRVCTLWNSARGLLAEPRIKFYITDSLEKGTSFITEKLSAFVVSIPQLILGIFITIISFFYFLKDGDKFLKKVNAILPLKKANRNLLYDKFVNISKAIVFGYFITALIQGATALVGFYIVNIFFSATGVPTIGTPLLWAAVLALFSMIPVLGSAFVWVPLSAAILIEGYFQNNSKIVWGGIFLFFYGLILISQIDNVIRPIISGRRAHIHPLVIFLGIFGGLVTFGVIGIVIGPILLALLLIYIKLYEEGNL